MSDVPFCASSPAAQAMTDDEFWDAVANYVVNPEPEYEPDDEDYPEMIVGFCLRCGGPLIAEDYQQLRHIVDCDHEICDDCADEVAEVPENDLWDVA